jgi:hypothetical protein
MTKKGNAFLMGCALLAMLMGISGIVYLHVQEEMPIATLVRTHSHHHLERRLATNASGIEDPDQKLLTPVQIAARDGCSVCLKALLSAGARPDQPVHPRHRHGYLPLHLAVINGNPEAVHLLASAGAAINATDAYDCTPLFYAIRFRHEGLVEHLLQLGATPHHRSACGWQPLHWAALLGANTAVPLLVRAGADVNDQILARFSMEKFVPPRGKQVGVLTIFCWPDKDLQKPPASFPVDLFNWGDSPDQRLPAELAEQETPRLSGPVALSRLLAKDTVTAYLQSHGGRD